MLKKLRIWKRELVLKFSSHL